MITLERTEQILKNAKSKPVLACGDVMLDVYLTGPVERLSQEAPVPIIAVEEEKFFPGGAGNAAACMAAIGITPHLVSVVGKENEKINYVKILEKEYERNGIISHFGSDETRTTIVKIRLVAIKSTKQQIARVDLEKTHPLNPAKEKEIMEYIKRLSEEIKPLALSIHDYKKGFLTENIFQLICSISTEKNIPIFADLKQDTFSNYKKLIKNPSLFYLKPNKDESVEAAKLINNFNKDGNTDEEIIEVSKIIQKKIPIQIIITRGRKGAVLFEIGKDPYFVRPKEIEEQFDVAGAGDTVAAFLIAAYLGGATMPEALEIAIAASQVAIRKFGTSVVTEKELFDWIEKNKV